MVTSSHSIVDISSIKNALILEIDKKLSGKLLSYRNDDYHDKPYPIEINKAEIENLLNGVDARLRNAQQLKLQFFDTLDHDFICGVVPMTSFGVRCSFVLPGTAIMREFEITDRGAYLDVVNTEFRDFILTVASLLENLVRLTETLVTKVIVNVPNKRGQTGSETLHAYREFMNILIKLEYRTKDDLPVTTAHARATIPPSESKMGAPLQPS